MTTAARQQQYDSTALELRGLAQWCRAQITGAAETQTRMDTLIATHRGRGQLPPPEAIRLVNELILADGHICQRTAVLHQVAALLRDRAVDQRTLDAVAATSYQEGLRDGIPVGEERGLARRRIASRHAAPSPLRRVQALLPIPVLAAVAGGGKLTMLARVAAGILAPHRWLRLATTVATAGAASGITLAYTLAPAPYTAAMPAKTVITTSVVPVPGAHRIDAATPQHNAAAHRAPELTAPIPAHHVPAVTQPVAPASSLMPASPGPGTLSLSSTYLQAGSWQVTLTATGAPVTWTARPSAGVTFIAPGGTIQPGTPVTVTVSVSTPVRCEQIPGPDGTVILATFPAG